MRRFIAFSLILSGFTGVSLADSDTSDFQTCPATFLSVPVYPQSKLCLSFDDSLPATMSYHAPASMQDVHSYYAEQLGEPTQNKRIKGRHLLSYAQGQQTIVISHDGNGSQVDILIKASQPN